MNRKTMLERWDEDDRIFLGMSIKEKLYPCILGGVVGDALGVPVEFKNRPLNITGMTGYGTYQQPAGTWSDDSSLTFCLIENLIEEKNENDLMEKFVLYRESGYWTPYGRMFDIGRTTDVAISHFMQGVPAIECGGNTEYDNGNGALMRISPLVFVLWSEPDFHKRKEVIENIVAVTHRHPRSTLGCIIYVQILIHLFNNNSIIRSYERAIEICIDHFSQEEKYKNELIHYKRILEKTILDFELKDIKSDGYIVHSLEAALWCLLQNNTYQDTVLAAVNLGNDADTIAFIAGTMAGMYYEQSSIPQEWIDQLARKNDILDLCERFFQFCFKNS